MLLPLLLASSAPASGVTVQATVAARIVRPVELRGAALTADGARVREGAIIERRCDSDAGTACRLVIYDLP